LIEYESVSIVWGIEQNQSDIGGSSFVVFRAFSMQPKGRSVPPVEELSFESEELHIHNTTGQHLRRTVVNLQEHR
jgi:hypothetical protein